jgi:hypothetical protein
MMQKEEKMAEQAKTELPFITEPIPERRKSKRTRKGSLTLKKEEGKK